MVAIGLTVKKMFHLFWIKSCRLWRKRSFWVSVARKRVLALQMSSRAHHKIGKHCRVGTQDGASRAISRERMSCICCIVLKTRRTAESDWKCLLILSGGFVYFIAHLRHSCAFCLALSVVVFERKWAFSGTAYFWLRLPITTFSLEKSTQPLADSLSQEENGPSACSSNVVRLKLEFGSSISGTLISNIFPPILQGFRNPKLYWHFRNICITLEWHL